MRTIHGNNAECPTPNDLGRCPGHEIQTEAEINAESRKDLLVAREALDKIERQIKNYGSWHLGERILDIVESARAQFKAP